MELWAFLFSGLGNHTWTAQQMWTLSSETVDPFWAANHSVADGRGRIRNPYLLCVHRGVVLLREAGGERVGIKSSWSAWEGLLEAGTGKFGGHGTSLILPSMLKPPQSEWWD